MGKKKGEAEMSLRLLLEGGDGSVVFLRGVNKK